jgi:tetratricopeptide (TPR) repeat protein
VLLEFGEAQALAGDVEGLRATFLEAARMAREQRDATALARAALGYGRMPSLQADDPILVGLLEEALRGLPSGDSVLRARLHARLVLATYYGGSLAERERHAREAVAIARRLGDSTTEAIALRSHYYNLVGTPDLPARLEILHDSVRAAERAGDRAVACEARVNMVGEYLELGDLARADRALAIAAETADRLRLPRLRWRATVLQAARALLSGDLAGAEACSDRALGMAGYGADSGDAMAVHTAVLFAVRRAQGRLAEIAPTVAAIAERGGSPNWQSLLALLHAETGARADAAGILARMAARHFADLRIDWSWLPTLAHFADVCAIVEDRSAAADLERLLRRDASPVVTAPFTCLGASSRYLGVLALVQGRADDAVRLLDEALALNLRLGAQVEVVRTQIALVRALAERGVAGDRERASTLHAEAETTAKLAGLAGFAPVLEQLLVQPARRTPARVLEASLRREGADWIVACAEESTRLRGTKGVGYLLRLLREPGRSFAALELAGSDVDPAVPGGAAAAEAVAVAPRERLRQRARELREELTEAEEFNDLGRAASLREEMEEIAEELSAGIRPDGRPTDAASDAKTAERARLNVTRALQAVVRRIGEGCPVLGGHLQSAIRTGSLCAYVPDPDPGIAWRL